MSGACGEMGGGESRNAYGSLEGRPEEKRPLGRRSRGLGDNIKIDLQGEEWACMDLIDLTMDRDGW